MNAKKMFQPIIVAALLVTSFVSTGEAMAWSQCPTYVTVQWGDTLSSIALLCGTTVSTIRAANPGLGWWVFAGQVLYIPTRSTSPSNPPTYITYKVKWGDTLGKIATRAGTSVSAILVVNPQIYNASLIYPGQVINLPAGVNVPPTSHYPLPPTTPLPPMDSYSTVNINYAYGMYIRSQPNGSIIASALDGSMWKYNQSNVSTDNKGRVWVEVKLYPPVKGYSAGWLMVKDNLGTYFTDPPVDNN